MSTSLKSRRPVRSLLLSAALWTILSLAPAGYYYLLSVFFSSFIFTSGFFWLWLAGIPLYYLLIGLLAAFRAGGYRSWGHSLKRGALIGFIFGGSGIILVVLVGLLVFIQFDYKLTHPTQGLFYFGWTLLLLWDFFFLLFNLLGVVLATLGGLLGGSVRFMRK